MSIEQLAQTVQFNCDLSDREFAADYSICIYLIRMREYYRWVHGFAPDASLDQSALMDWVSDKELAWDEMAENDFRPLEFEGTAYSAFDSVALNHKLHAAGYTYSAGYGRFAKPVFVLAELESSESNEHYQLTLAGRELARELTAPPAVMQAGQIFIRSESVSRMIWDLYEEWQWHRPDNAMAEVVRHYDFESAPLQALEEASEDQREVLILHEIGELMAGKSLDSRWDTLLLSDSRHLQLFARGVRDYLADCLSTLPGLLAQDNVPGVHFYFASLTPMRKAMFPMLETAYRRWRRDGDSAGIKQAIRCGQTHWQTVAEQLCNKVSLQSATATLQEYIERHQL